MHSDLFDTIRYFQRYLVTQIIIYAQILKFRTSGDITAPSPPSHRSSTDAYRSGLVGPSDGDARNDRARRPVSLFCRSSSRRGSVARVTSFPHAGTVSVMVRGQRRARSHGSHALAWPSRPGLVVELQRGVYHACEIFETRRQKVNDVKVGVRQALPSTTT